MTETFVDYYAVLGITFGATDEQIKRGYRTCMKKYHPDMRCTINLTKDEEEYYKIRYQASQEAYEVLSDSDKKKKYDILYQKEQQRQAEEKRRRAEYREAQRQRKAEQEAQEEGVTAEHETRNNEKLSFTSKIKKAYDEIREEEKKMPLSKRHRRLERVYEKGRKEDFGLGEEIVFNVKKGTCHVFLELLYQLEKITHVNDDTVTKYIIRNRKTIAALAIAGTLFSVSSKMSKEKPVIDDQNTTTYTTISPDVNQTQNKTTQPMAPSTQEDIVLTRYYKVQAGDTLSGISSDSNTLIETIKKVNNLESNTIYANQELKIPYYVKEYELQYYTESYAVEDKTLAEIAEERHTDVATLLRLNEEAILKVEDGKYMIMTYEIKVPKFITPAELRELKDARQYK